MNMVFSFYPVFIAFLLGLSIAFTGQWLYYNHHRKFVTFIVVITFGWLVGDGIMSIFNPDTLLRQTYSELQGWIDFVSGVAGAMLGFFLENRYERRNA